MCQGQKKYVEIVLHGGAVFVVGSEFSEIAALVEATPEISEDEFIHGADCNGDRFMFRKKDVLCISEVCEEDID